MTGLSPYDGLPLPELVDLRFIPNKKKVVFFIRVGEVSYTKRLNLALEGAGLHDINVGVRSVTFAREQKTLPASQEYPFGRVVLLGGFSLAVTRKMAELLAQLFWGRVPDLSGWPAAEGVQAALANAAD